MGLVIEYFLYIAILMSAIMVASSRNVLMSALGLAINTTVIGFLFILKGLTFLGIVQIAVYAGGIIVLILMTIMILSLGSKIEFTYLSLLKSLLIFLLVFLFVYYSLSSLNFNNTNFDVKDLGDLLANNYLYHLLSLGVLLNAILVSYLLISRDD